MQSIGPRTTVGVVGAGQTTCGATLEATTTVWPGYGSVAPWYRSIALANRSKFPTVLGTLIVKLAVALADLIVIGVGNALWIVLVPVFSANTSNITLVPAGGFAPRFRVPTM